ncbi:GxxExxY protein [Geothermobacter hydrogeniphilus]|uniref:GxxExxY protein n=1 Tax=Geothermobacter hydrogeniphilus TaxID=1969733 RepID=A0A2K2HD71_9BACT|nr:GxxExxY protein [Geothermobacter hydrogeniphilus]PNU21219.1 GxxExxY protein [Geothermobacter hydrogeniphilus]
MAAEKAEKTERAGFAGESPPGDEITRRIICCFYTVYNRLGFGFLEKVYERALAYELTKAGLSVQCQVPIRVHYDGLAVGEFFADILINEEVVVELKATKKLAPEHEAQLLNYLWATDLEVGLLLNFGPEPVVNRRVFRKPRQSG